MIRKVVAASERVASFEGAVYPVESVTVGGKIGDETERLVVDLHLGKLSVFTAGKPSERRCNEDGASVIRLSNGDTIIAVFDGISGNHHSDIATQIVASMLGLITPGARMVVDQAGESVRSSYNRVAALLTTLGERLGLEILGIYSNCLEQTFPSVPYCLAVVHDILQDLKCGVCATIIQCKGKQATVHQLGDTEAVLFSELAILRSSTRPTSSKDLRHWLYNLDASKKDTYDWYHINRHLVSGSLGSHRADLAVKKLKTLMEPTGDLKRFEGQTLTVTCGTPRPLGSILRNWPLTVLEGASVYFSSVSGPADCGKVEQFNFVTNEMQCCYKQQRFTIKFGQDYKCADLSRKWKLGPEIDVLLEGMFCLRKCWGEKARIEIIETNGTSRTLDVEACEESFKLSHYAFFRFKKISFGPESPSGFLVWTYETRQQFYFWIEQQVSDPEGTVMATGRYLGKDKKIHKVCVKKEKDQSPKLFVDDGEQGPGTADVQVWEYCRLGGSASVDVVGLEIRLHVESTNLLQIMGHDVLSHHTGRITAATLSEVDDVTTVTFDLESGMTAKANFCTNGRHSVDIYTANEGAHLNLQNPIFSISNPGNPPKIWDLTAAKQLLLASDGILDSLAPFEVQFLLNKGGIELVWQASEHAVNLMSDNCAVLGAAVQFFKALGVEWDTLYLPMKQALGIRNEEWCYPVQRSKNDDRVLMVLELNPT